MRREAEGYLGDMKEAAEQIAQFTAGKTFADYRKGIDLIGAGEGNRTLVFSLEGCCSTIELHPRLKAPERVRRDDFMASTRLEVN